MQTSIEEAPRSLLVRLNEEFESAMGWEFFLGRQWDPKKARWTYHFADGSEYLTYRGSLYAMQSALRLAVQVQDDNASD